MDAATIAAGKPIPRDHGAQQCLVTPTNMPRTPDHLKKFSQRRNPDVGQSRSHYPTAIDETVQHGKKTAQSINADELLNPKPMTLFQSKLSELNEGIYSSRIKGPLGRCPSGEHVAGDQTFGKKTIKGDSAVSLVSPPKTRAQVEEESLIGKDLYRLSHHDYGVGEIIDRNYTWDKFTKDTKYGVPTPHDNTGKEVNLAMNWQKSVPVISKQLDDFRERHQPQLGRVHDPIADTLRVSPDHTFGVTVQCDDYDAGKLLHTSGPSTYLQCNSFDKGILSSIRCYVKRQCYSDFDYLLNGLRKLAADEFISKRITRKLLVDYQVPLEPEMMELLLTWCSIESDERVNYELLVQLINWKLDLDTSQLEIAINNNNKSKQEMCEHDEIIKQHNYKTTSQQIRAVAGEIPTAECRTFGTPTIRTDRPPPRIRRVADGTNYGDESDSYGLMYPSIYSSCGVYEQDFFTPRSSEQIRAIFSNIGADMSDTQFKMFWEKAASRDGNGQVCVESFREVLEEMQINKQQQQQQQQQQQL